MTGSGGGAARRRHHWGRGHVGGARGGASTGKHHGEGITSSTPSTLALRLRVCEGKNLIFCTVKN